MKFSSELIKQCQLKLAPSNIVMLVWGQVLPELATNQPIAVHRSPKSHRLSQPPQGREIIRTERTPEERNGEINKEEANKPSQT